MTLKVTPATSSSSPSTGWASGIGAGGTRGQDVVDVGVAGDDSCDANAHVAGQGQDRLGLVARVDDARLAAPSRADDPAVLAKQADHDASDLELNDV
jgi:hypothetical protein